MMNLPRPGPISDDSGLFISTRQRIIDAVMAKSEHWNQFDDIPSELRRVPSLNPSDLFKNIQDKDKRDPLVYFDTQIYTRLFCVVRDKITLLQLAKAANQDEELLLRFQSLMHEGMEQHTEGERVMLTEVFSKWCRQASKCGEECSVLPISMMSNVPCLFVTAQETPNSHRLDFTTRRRNSLYTVSFMISRMPVNMEVDHCNLILLVDVPGLTKGEADSRREKSDHSLVSRILDALYNGVHFSTMITEYLWPGIDFYRDSQDLEAKRKAEKTFKEKATMTKFERRRNELSQTSQMSQSQNQRQKVMNHNHNASLVNGHGPNSNSSSNQNYQQQPRDPTPSKESHSQTPNSNSAIRRSEIYRYNADKPLFTAAWSHKSDLRYRLAVGTLAEREQGNKVSIIQLEESGPGELVEKTNFPTDFPVNAISFIPDLACRFPDLIATSGDCLKIWKINDNNSVSIECQLTSNKSSQYSSALTSLTWNEVEPRLIGTSSIDTTCTIFEIETGQAIGTVKPSSTTAQVKTQLIAHDKPVHDIAFSKVHNGQDHFATVGADGSARMFDLRHLEHSTIVYEDPHKTPLMRLAWNQQEPFYLATFAQDSSEITILDIRIPCNPLSRLKNHSLAVNGIAWAPHSSSHICSAGDDMQALIWDLQHLPRPIEDPILAYSAAGEHFSSECDRPSIAPPCLFATRFRLNMQSVAGGVIAVSKPLLMDQPSSSSSSLPSQSATFLFGTPGSTRTGAHYATNLAPQPYIANSHPTAHLPATIQAQNPISGQQAGSSSAQSQTQHNPQLTPQMMQTDAVENMDAAGPSNPDTSMGSVSKEEDKRKEIYGYDAPHTLFSSAWSLATDPQRRFRLAASSFIEEYSNKIYIVQLDEEAGELVLRNSFDHPYPATKVAWIPDTKGNYPDLIATSGDYLRLWKLGADNSAKIEALLNTNRTAEYCAPLTSFDWNEVDLNLIGTSSIDTTCTVWQLETGQAIGSTRSVDGTVRTQLIAHDKEVFDISFSRGNKDLFASVGADGSVRLFDLRHLEHSTIIYEDAARTPLLRLSWNRNDNNYLATFAMDSCEVIILDMRLPCTPVAKLSNHRASINGISWAPHSSSHICTGGDDSMALIWDVHELPRPIDDPILAYQAGGEVKEKPLNLVVDNYTEN
ncbi:hypothetical protein WR25_17500 [Diploscapter pachys]|uniref:Uncharacterized protein n=1 Tax=Diploscapter pachys TaxID=2018661 RepID=A0A2A2L6K2_9BILA|nr:hypothetical protein WR25_17500 [Diploscapter pachys]